MGELFPIECFVVGMALQVLFTVVLTLWGGWVARRRGNGRFWRVAKWLPWTSFGMACFGVAISVLMLISSFGRIATVDPSNKAQVLSESISHAMMGTALLATPGYALLALAIVSFAVGTLRAPAPPTRAGAPG